MLNNQINKYCELCGNEFTSIRPNAKFCSNSCRTKANNQRRDAESKEAEYAKKRAEIEDAKRIASDTRKLKKAKEDANIAKAKHLAEIELEIQAEIDAYELSVKKQKINSIVEMLLAKAEADAWKLKRAELRKMMEDNTKKYKEMREAKAQEERLGKLIAGIFYDLATPNNGRQKPAMDLDTTTKSGNFPSAGTTLPFYYSNSFTDSLAPDNSPQPIAVGAVGVFYKSVVALPPGEIIANSTKNESGLKKVFDDIFSLTDIF